VSLFDRHPSTSAQRGAGQHGWPRQDAGSERGGEQRFLVDTFFYGL
jgi:hypothetical protein